MVAHSCHGKTRNLTAKTKYLTAKTKTSRQNRKPHGKNKNLNARVICIQDLLLSLNSTDSYNELSKKVCKTNILEWAGLRRSIPLSLRSYDRYPSINSPTFVVGDNTFDVTKGKSKDYYNLFIREKAKPPTIIKKLQSNFHFNSDNLKGKYLSCLTLSLSNRMLKLSSTR